MEELPDKIQRSDSKFDYLKEDMDIPQHNSKGKKIKEWDESNEKYNPKCDNTVQQWKRISGQTLNSNDIGNETSIRLFHSKWEKNIQHETIILFQTYGNENNYIGN